MNDIKMLYFDKIDIFEIIDINKTSASKERDICHYWYFWNKGFKFQPNLCNRCHDLIMISTKLSDIAITKMKNTDYLCIITGISKSIAMKLLHYVDLTKNNETWWN